MLFNSYVFIFIFLPITLIGFHFFSKYRTRNVSFGWLVACSLFFYSYWNPAYLPLILFSVVFNYFIGRKLGENPNRKVLIIGVAVNLALLGYFKYFNFFIDSANYIWNTSWQIESILLPLAISFFTFQQIAYLVDAYRGLCKEYKFVNYCLFVTFFPQLIAGPIVHHEEMLPQFERSGYLGLRRINIIIGLAIFTIGLFKKVVIADTFALYATPIFTMADSGEDLNFFEAWQGVLAYTFQLYFDFSGYSDMAIGLARLFGIRLPVNFDSPYKATNIIDFWRRWHITLSRFLRDYLYITLGGNRKGRTRRYINLSITMVLGGLWHGAGVNFIIWGALHGGYLVVNHAWRKICLWPSLTNHRIYRAFSTLITFLAVVVGWTFFRAETLHGAFRLLDAMTNLPNSVGNLLGDAAVVLGYLGIRFDGGYLASEHVVGAILFFLTFIFVLTMPNTQQWMVRYKPVFQSRAIEPTVRILNWRPSMVWSFIMGFLITISILSMTKVSEFLYFQF